MVKHTTVNEVTDLSLSLQANTSDHLLLPRMSYRDGVSVPVSSPQQGVDQLLYNNMYRDDSLLSSLILSHEFNGIEGTGRIGDSGISLLCNDDDRRHSLQSLLAQALAITSGIDDPNEVQVENELFGRRQRPPSSQSQ